MNAGFVRRGDGIYRAFSEDEVRVLRGLVEGLDRTIVEGDATDEVLTRLAPAGYGPEEAESAAEFAEFTRQRILDGKRERLAVVTAGLDRADLLALDPAEAQAWLLAINDLRLALAERIGVDRLDAQNLDPNDGAQNSGATGEIYDWLGWLQSGLLDALG